MGAAALLLVDEVDEPIGDLVRRTAPVVRTFGERSDSKATVVGVDDGHDRFIVKYAEEPAAVAWLESAVRFHAAVRHPVITPVLHHLRTASGGLALVEAWAPGEVLVDHFDPAVPRRDQPGSPYQRFLALPAATIAAAVTHLLDAHVAVALAGFVAVDLHDGCLVHDAAGAGLQLIDLDSYRPGPFVLDVDRQLGSTATMAPEEHVRGATIDERTTVFTLGRFAHVLLGGDRDGPPHLPGWRAGPALFDVVRTACEEDPGRRHRTVADLQAAWEAALPSVAG